MARDKIYDYSQRIEKFTLRGGEVLFDRPDGWLSASVLITLGQESVEKASFPATATKAEVRNVLNILDSRLRGNDVPETGGCFSTDSNSLLGEEWSLV